MKHETKFAILGCGRIGQRHAEHITQQATLTAVCDIVPERANALAVEHGARTYHSLEALLGDAPDVEVVAVCTPNGLHAEQTVAICGAGKHVVCEKPMALNVADCGRMIAAAEAANRELFVVKQNRFNPPIAALKAAVDEGRLGRVFNVQLNCFWNRNAEYYDLSDWKGSRTLDGGTLFTQFSHFVDLLYWLGGEVRHVQAFANNFLHRDLIEFEDTGVVALVFESGALGTINYTVNSHAQNMEGSITLFGDRGTVKVGGQYLNVLEYQQIDGYEITGMEASRPANDYGFYQGSMSNHDRVYENVLNVLHHGGTVATNGFEGMKTVEIIERIYEVMATHHIAGVAAHG